MHACMYDMYLYVQRITYIHACKQHLHLDSQVQVRDMPDCSARWIAKPSITNQATGICIFDRVSQLVEALHANEDLREWVLQR